MTPDLIESLAVVQKDEDGALGFFLLKAVFDELGDFQDLILAAEVASKACLQIAE